jgi:hypothetical protein
MILRAVFRAASAGHPESAGGPSDLEPDYVRAEAKWHGVGLTLSPHACSALAAGLGIRAAISSALALIPGVGLTLAVVIGVVLPRLLGSSPS